MTRTRTEGCRHPWRRRTDNSRFRKHIEQRRHAMSTIMITHEVEDVAHWVSSPTRGELFPTLGITHRTFVDPTGSNLVGIVAEVPDMDAFQAFLGTDAA